LKAGTQSGSRHRVKGKGIELPKQTGDLIVTVDVHVPTKLSDEERSAIDTLSEVLASPRTSGNVS
jgi:molecular chaperone DnaJ